MIHHAGPKSRAGPFENIHVNYFEQNVRQSLRRTKVRVEDPTPPAAAVPTAIRLVAAHPMPTAKRRRATR